MARRPFAVRPALVVGFSAVVVAGVTCATFVFALGVHISLGPGISSRLGSQVVHDFLVDQNAESSALSNTDESALDNRLTDSALADVAQEVHNQSGQTIVQFQPSTISVLRAQDPNDPSLGIEVVEDGVKTVTTISGPDSAPSQNQVSFHAAFWLRPSPSGYTIADQDMQNLPTSLAPEIALIGTGLLWVALLSLLLRRVRRRLPVVAQDEAKQPTLRAPLPVDRLEPWTPQAKTVIRMFGGLQVLEDGKDWAPELNGRPLMAFVWRRVLLAELEGRVIAREEVARQANPTLDRETQLLRLRNVLHRGVRSLPTALRNRIVVQPQVLRFDLDGCWVDALELRAAAADCLHPTPLSSAQIQRARRAIDASRGVLMPEFEAVDDLATDHHPSCGELIRSLRQQLSDDRVRLMLAVASAKGSAAVPGARLAVDAAGAVEPAG